MATTVQSATPSLGPAHGWIARARQRAFRQAPMDRDLVVLRHSRIYVLPTRRGLAVIATLAIMLLTSLNYALSLGFVVTFLLTGMVGAALLHTYRNLAGLEIRPLAAAETFAGDELTFSLALVGHGSTRSAVSLLARGAQATLVHVPASGTLTTTLKVGPVARGRVPLGRVTVASDFPLGLWRAWAYVHFPIAGIAWPAPESGAPALPLAEAGSETAASGRGDEAELAGLRSYQPGDPLQRVAWKAVARGAGWYSKAFESEDGGGSLILDWAALPSALSTEGRLSRLTAWTLLCERAARSYGVRLPETAIGPGQGREHRRAVLTALALHPKAQA